MTWSEASPFRVIEQYFSEVLAGNGDAPRLATLRQLYATGKGNGVLPPRLFNTLRKLLYNRIAQCGHRVDLLVEKTWPWPMLGLADARRSTTDRANVGQRWCDTRPCCLDPGCGRKMRASGVDSVAKVNAHAPKLGEVALELDCEIADMECRNGRCKREAHQCQSSTLVASNYCLREASFHKATFGSDDPGLEPVEDEDPSLERDSKSCWSPKHAFHHHRLALVRANGGEANPASAAAWAQTQQLWHNLSDGEVCLYADMAKLRRDVPDLLNQMGVLEDEPAPFAPLLDEAPIATEGAIVISSSEGASDVLAVPFDSPRPLAPHEYCKGR